MGYICLKMVKHCVPQTWNKPVPGGRGGTQKHPKSVPWNNPFHPFLAHQTRDGTPRSVPSRPVPRTKRTLTVQELLYLKEGTLVEGTVKKIFPYGAQVRIG
ncbi:hypothetical protein DVH24_016393 [Malus domestica]|uniref:S1 motif domain-containing protein n=1 Tax=Malus domestica TaxID=3750 RepID=A0A498HWN0_MALDO|nr:hypothetical protein DVH24_016393 [Malus domestica]